MAESSKPTRAVEVFFSYSHKDEDLRDELSKHLALMKRQRVITAWHDRKIGAGTEWENEIDEHLNTADIILLLISSDFLASDYCYDIEVKTAMKRHDEGEARVIPVILRPVDLKGALFGKLQALPKEARPVTDWPNRDQAFLNVAQSIRAAIEELQLQWRPLEASIVTEPQASAAASTHSPDRPPIISPSRGKIHMHADVDPRALPDLAVFKDIDASWCPEMAALPSGKLMMGSPDTGEEGNAKPQRQVEINYRFAVGRYPVMFDEYDHFCEEIGRWKPGDQGYGRGRRPVINVNWMDAKAYCEWLAQETGKPYRLLTEAEWEYACRAGTTTRYAFGDRISKSKARYGLLAWNTVEAGGYPPNLWGLFDMHGNVWEWVEDVYGNYSGAPSDGSPRLEGKDRDYRVVRGGSFRAAESTLLRSDFRTSHKYMESQDDLGFRVAYTL
jgi:formylglycine-generating enzyme required for sulfatase activity